MKTLNINMKNLPEDEKEIIWEQVRMLLQAMQTGEGNMGLKERVEMLEIQMRPKRLPYGRIYDALYQMEVSTSPVGPDETQEQWEARFIQENGTREQFVENGKLKEEQ